MKPRLILSLTLILLSVSSSIAQTNSSEPATLALINGRIWLGNDGATFAEAVAIRGDRILQVGATAEIKKLADSNTQVIDLGRRLVIPGFNDAHIHFLGGSLGLSQVDLTDAKNAAEIIERVAAFAKGCSNAGPNAPWITGRGWQYTSFPGGLPTKSYLDAIIKDRPVFLSAYDGHTGWVNSRAMELAGITRETKFDGYGEIVRDASGDATGALKEGAQGLVRRLIPEPARQQKLDALRQGMKLAARLGITSIQNASGSPDELSLYDELLKRGELTLRVSMAFSVSAKTTPQEMDRFVQLKNQYDLNPMLRAAAVKFAIDGVIESHTAAMIEPYSDLPPNHGAPMGELYHAG